MGQRTTSLPDHSAATVAQPGRSVYPWVVFALVFSLLLSDYMSRQVLNAIFPFLKSDWGVSDSQLASLSSVVALTVGLLTLPLSLLADRWGRLKSLAVMAVVWSAATVLCAVAGNYQQMLAARFLVGVGEAAYGSVGIAVVLSVFAPRVHATLSGSFMAGTTFGSMIGVAAGGAIATHMSWRWSLACMAVLGLILVAVFRVVVTERRLARHRIDPDPANDTASGTTAGGNERARLSSLVTNPAVLCAYLGSALQMFTAAALLAWLPSFFNRDYHLVPDRAGAAASGFVLLIGVGMVCCGILTDWAGRLVIYRKWVTAVVYCAISLVTLTTGFLCQTGPLQLILIGIGAFFSGGSSGAVTAMVAHLTHPSIRSSAFGTVTVVNNLLGMALGPFVVGILADHLGLRQALQLAPLAYLLAIAALLAGRYRHIVQTSAVPKLAV
ncbi:MFS transporter [Nocardia sp. CA-151230]|uniref:MFS transporter n=1 Tax=Nocardia sp. CA-151230 TaxID=3239982 RepID=UPI003D8C4322